MKDSTFVAKFKVETEIAEALASLTKLSGKMDELWGKNAAPKSLLKSVEELRERLGSLSTFSEKGVLNREELQAAQQDFRNIKREIHGLQTEFKLLSTEQKKALLSPDVKSNLDARTRALKDYTKELQKQISYEEKQLKLQKEITAKTLELSKKRQSLPKKSDNAVKVEKYQQLSAESSSAEKRIESLRKSGKFKEGEGRDNTLTRLVAQKQQVDADIAALQLNPKQIAEGEKELNALAEATKNLMSESAALEKHLTELNEEIASLKATAPATKTIDELKNKLASLGVTGLESADSVEKIQERLKDLETEEIAKIIGPIEDAEAALGEMAKTASNMGDTFREATEEIKAQDEALANQEAFNSRIKQFIGLQGAAQLMRRALNNAFQTIEKLDAAMAEMAVVTDTDISGYWDQLPQYTDRANALGLAIRDVYQADTLFYQQGLKTQEVVELSTQTMKMARVAGLDTAEATDRMTAALRGFNMELNETNAQKVADVYSELAAITASDVDEISSAMTKTASIASNAGMEFETTAAFLSQIIETTRESAETAGTAMKTVIARFQELKKDPAEIGEIDGEIVDANKIETALRSVGVALRDANGQFRDLDDVFLELASKWDSLDTNTQRYIATIAAGSRQQSRFIAMMSDYGRTQELVNAANTSAGASNEQFEKTMESLSAKLNQLKNAWDSFTMGFLESDMIKFFVDALTKLITILDKVTKAFGGFSGTIAKLGMVFTVFKTGQVLYTKFAKGIVSKFKTIGYEAGKSFKEGMETAAAEGEREMKSSKAQGAPKTTPKRKTAADTKVGEPASKIFAAQSSKATKQKKAPAQDDIETLKEEEYVARRSGEELVGQGVKDIGDDFRKKITSLTGNADIAETAWQSYAHAIERGGESASRAIQDMNLELASRQSQVFRQRHKEASATVEAEQAKLEGKGPKKQARIQRRIQNAEQTKQTMEANLSNVDELAPKVDTSGLTKIETGWANLEQSGQLRTDIRGKREEKLQRIATEQKSDKTLEAEAQPDKKPSFDKSKAFRYQKLAKQKREEGARLAEGSEERKAKAEEIQGLAENQLNSGVETTKQDFMAKMGQFKTTGAQAEEAWQQYEEQIRKGGEDTSKALKSLNTELKTAQSNYIKALQEQCSALIQESGEAVKETAEYQSLVAELRQAQKEQASGAVEVTESGVANINEGAERSQKASVVIDKENQIQSQAKALEDEAQAYDQVANEEKAKRPKLSQRVREGAQNIGAGAKDLWDRKTEAVQEIGSGISDINTATNLNVEASSLETEAEMAGVQANSLNTEGQAQIEAGVSALETSFKEKFTSINGDIAQAQAIWDQYVEKIRAGGETAAEAVSSLQEKIDQASGESGQNPNQNKDPSDQSGAPKKGARQKKQSQKKSKKDDKKKKKKDNKIEVEGLEQIAEGQEKVAASNAKREESEAKLAAAQQKREEADQLSEQGTQKLSEGLEKTGQGFTKVGGAIMGMGVAAAAGGELLESMGLNGAAEAGAKLGNVMATTGTIMTALGGIMSFVATLTKAETVASIASAVANFLESGSLIAVGISAISAATGMSPLLVITLLIMAAILILVAVIIGLVAAFKAIQKNSPEGKLKAAEAAAEAAGKAADEAAEAYENLKSAFESLGDKYSALEELTRGTREWRDAVKEINNEVTDLIDQYPELANLVTNEDGVLKIDLESDAAQAVLDKYETDAAIKKNAELASKISASEKKDDVEYKALERKSRTGMGQETDEKLAQAMAQGLIVKGENGWQATEGSEDELSSLGLAADEAVNLANALGDGAAGLKKYGEAIEARRDQEDAMYEAMAMNAASMVDTAAMSDEGAQQIAVAANSDYMEAFIDKAEDDMEEATKDMSSGEKKDYYGEKAKELYGEDATVNAQGKVTYTDEEGNKQTVEADEFKRQYAAMEATEMAAEALEKLPDAIDAAAVELEKFSKGAGKALNNIYMGKDGSAMTRADVAAVSNFGAQNNNWMGTNTDLQEAWKNLSAEEREAFGDFGTFQKTIQDSIKIQEQAFARVDDTLGKIGVDNNLSDGLTSASAQGLADSITSIVIANGKEAGQQYMNNFNAITKNMNSEDMNKFASMVNAIDPKDAKAWDDLKIQIQESGLAANMSASELNDFIEKSKAAAHAIEKIDLTKFTEELKTLGQIIKEIRSGERDRTFSEEEYQAIIEMDPSLAKDFMMTYDGYEYIGKSMEGLAKALDKNTEATAQKGKESLENKIEIGNATEEFRSNHTTGSELSANYIDWTDDFDVEAYAKEHGMTVAEVDTAYRNNTLSDEEEEYLKQYATTKETGELDLDNYKDWDEDTKRGYLNNIVSYYQEQGIDLDDGHITGIGNGTTKEGIYAMDDTALDAAIQSILNTESDVAAGTVQDELKVATQNIAALDYQANDISTNIANRRAKVGTKEEQQMNTSVIISQARALGISEDKLNAYRFAAQFGHTGTMRALEEEFLTLSNMAKKVQENVEAWESPYTKLTNLNAEINKGLMEREKLERAYERALWDSTTDADQLSEIQKEQLLNIQNQIELAKSQKEEGLAEMQKTWDKGPAQWQELVSIDEATGTVTVDHEQLEEQSWKDNPELLSQFEEWVSSLEGNADIITEAEEAIWENTEAQRDIYNQGRDATENLYDRVAEALISERQEEIDALTTINDSINEAQSQLLSSMQQQIDEQRQARNNEKTEQNIADAEARLAYLRQDTSGANALEIAKLEKSIGQQKENYQDTLVDQALQDMQKANEEAALQRERQITIQQQQLDAYSESTQIWSDVKSVIDNSLAENATGVPLDETRLSTILANSENVDAMNPYTKETWYSDLNDTVANVKTFMGTDWEAIFAPDDEPETNSYQINTEVDYALADSQNTGSSSATVSSPTVLQSKISSNFAVAAYKTGGLADFTGPAWLDGTKSHPELVLNQRDTENFIALKDILSDVMNSNMKTTSTQKSGDNYFDIEINIDSLENDYDVEDVANKIRDMIYNDAMYRNVNAVNQKM